MAADENKTIEEFTHFASYHFKMLKVAKNSNDGYILEIKVSGYSDMIRLGMNLMNMCLHILQTDALDNKEMDIGAVMELALQLFPRAELEVLDEIQEMLLKENSSNNIVQ